MCKPIHSSTLYLQVFLLTPNRSFLLKQTPRSDEKTTGKVAHFAIFISTLLADNTRFRKRSTDSLSLKRQQCMKLHSLQCLHRLAMKARPRRDRFTF